MRIDRNSRGTLALVYLLSIAAGCALLLFVHIPWIVWPLIALLLWFCAWQTAFFRVPERTYGGSPDSVTSVADGTVVIAEKVFEDEYLKRECIQLSVYMNFFDVHANFWPADGEITYYHYYPGEHFLAFAPKASAENEHSCQAARKSSSSSWPACLRAASSAMPRWACRSRAGSSAASSSSARASTSSCRRMRN